MIIITSSSFWTSILAFLTFKDPLLPVELIGMVVCFGGMVTLTLSGAKSSEGSEEYVVDPPLEETESASNQLIIGYCLAFVCSWIASTNCILNRALSHVDSAVVMFWYGVGGLILAIAAVSIEAAITEGPMHIFHCDTRVYLLMLGAVLFDTLAS